LIHRVPAATGDTQAAGVVQLTDSQLAIANAPLDGRLFIHGIAGTGKTTAGALRLRFLLENGVPGDQILVLAPQRTLHEPYLEVLREPGLPAGTGVTPATMGGLARRMCDLFWPLVSARGGFGRPEQPPVFLTLETSQYYMARLVRPLLDAGYFASVTMDRNRLYAQILDSLNKSAAVGFPHTEIGSRLTSAWVGEPERRRIYADAQECASRFRAFCLEHNLLDFSLQLELFLEHLWPHPQVRQYLLRTYRYLIYDNVEEDVPRAHDLIREWLRHFVSGTLIHDDDAGYRQFLGADPQSGWNLQDVCDNTLSLKEGFVMSQSIRHLLSSLEHAIDPGADSSTRSQPEGSEAENGALRVVSTRFYPELLDGIVSHVRQLITEEHVPAGQVVIVAPFLSDALRFALTNRLRAAGIPWKTHRPSRSLREEPASRALMTIAAIAHPAWDRHPVAYDVAHAFALALKTDLIRARLLADIVYRQRTLGLSAFEQIQTEQAERLTAGLGHRYSRLRDWLLRCRDEPALPLDLFLRRLFGELLSQPGFGLHRDLDSARVVANLVESVRKFRIMAEANMGEDTAPELDSGLEYARMLEEGVLAAQYIDARNSDLEEAVLVSPAYSFLMMNRAAAAQIWLDGGSDGWWQRLDQPLTHTHVLSREWPAGREWTYAEEDRANTLTMKRLVIGLLRRCRQSVILGVSNLGEAGFEQRGRLLTAFQGILPHERAR
jgi:hypothetical protein